MSRKLTRCGLAGLLHPFVENGFQLFRTEFGEVFVEVVPARVAFGKSKAELVKPFEHIAAGERHFFLVHEIGEHRLFVATGVRPFRLEAAVALRAHVGRTLGEQDKRPDRSCRSGIQAHAVMSRCRN